MQNTNTGAAAAPTQMPPEAVLMQMMMGCFVTQAIAVAAELKIADLLSEKPLSVGELAKSTDSHERALYRVLRSLSAVGIFAETDERVFALTPLGELLQTGTPNSLRDAAIFMAADYHWRVYSGMRESVRDGKPAWGRTHGAEVFDYFQNNPPEAEIFNRAMTSMSVGVIPPIVAAATENGVFAGVQTLCDVAGGHGALLVGFLRANPSVKGVLFDTPEVVAGADNLLNKENVAERVEKVAGDFFEKVPAGADAYVLKHIIHDWDDARAVRILGNIAAAMNENGKVVIVEMVVPPGNEPHPAKFLDLEMLVSPGGVERTANEYRELLAAANLKLTRIIPTRSPFSLIEAVKAD